MMLPPPPPPANTADGFDPWSRHLHGPTTPDAATAARLWQAHLEFQDQARALLPTGSLEGVRRLVADARQDAALARLRAAGDGRKWQESRTEARHALPARLRQAVPGYAELRALQQQHLTDLVERATQLPPFLEPVVNPVDPDAVVFREPFSLGSVGDVDDVLPTMAVVDRSFTRREIGHFIVDADLRADPGAVWGLNEVFGIFPLNSGQVSAACGVSYTLPQAGRLLVTASLRNYYTRVTLALHDEWGSSSGRLSVSMSLFLTMLRPDGGEVLHSGLGHVRLDSDGDDVTTQLPDVEQGVFNLIAATETRFEAGESVTVLAGACVTATSALNDMEAHVRPLLWWELQELGITIVQ